MDNNILTFSSSLLNEQLAKVTLSIEELCAENFLKLELAQQQRLLKSLTLSDFIYRSFTQRPVQILTIFEQNTSYSADDLPDYDQLLEQALSDISSEPELHKALRIFRVEHMVKIAIADLVDDHKLTLSLVRLSNLADALILGANNWLREHFKDRWGIPCNSEGEEQPLLVYGMGKLGGKELNFSSDIDLIFTYPETGETQHGRKVMDNHQYFTRIGQKLITALNSQTADGFVYRVDMRLRPFGESGPLVLSFSALEDYYQEQGRDWERYAMLKARVIGHSEYHHMLTKMLRPFVYRRYIDFSVIDSLRKMKMMIAQEVRRKQLTNNIKLGAGGIREIEFIVQVFQLIRGGRISELQQRSLLTVLPKLVEYQEISEQSEQVLTQAYYFLRRLENIIQALDDKQTQTLPESELDKQRILAVLGIGTWLELLAILQTHMDAVHHEFGLLIGQESPHHQDVADQWATLWESQWSDEDTVDWINQLAPNWQEQAIWPVLSHFRDETNKRAIGRRGREVLGKLMPLLIQHFYQASHGKVELERVLTVLERVLTRTAYLELLLENEGALVHLIKLCHMSQWLAEHIAKYPILLDELIDPKLLHNPPALSSYRDELQQFMLRVPDDDIEMQMDSLRQFKQAQQLRIAAADIVGVLPVMKVSDHLTALAEAIIAEVIQQAWRQVTKRFGQPKSTADTDHKGFAVIGYGKMGGIELGYGSDLDLVFIHDAPSDDMTNGDREIPASQFYMKLAQKIMHIFNTRMASGILYELDMRLRPSGNSGVLMIHIDAFDNYQKTEAWTWEHQALVRARAIYGHESLCQAFEQSRHTILSQPRSETELKGDVVKMRNKMRDHLDKSTDELCDVKQGVGGLVDIEFMVQYWVLANSSLHNKLAHYSDNMRIIDSLMNIDVVEQQDGQFMQEAYQQLRAFGHRQVLQNESSLMKREDFEEISKHIKTLWHKTME